MGLRCNFHFLQLSPTQSPVLSQASFYRIFKYIAMHKSNKFFFKIFFLFYNLKCHTPPISLFYQGLEKKSHLFRSCVITKELHDNLQKLAFIKKATLQPVAFSRKNIPFYLAERLPTLFISIFCFIS